MERFEGTVAARLARRQAKAKAATKFRPSDEPKGERHLVSATLVTVVESYHAVSDERERFVERLSLRDAEAALADDLYEHREYLRSLRRAGVYTPADREAMPVPTLPTGRIAAAKAHLRELDAQLARYRWEICELEAQLAEARRYRR